MQKWNAASGVMRPGAALNEILTAVNCCNVTPAGINQLIYHKIYEVAMHMWCWRKIDLEVYSFIAICGFLG